MNNYGSHVITRMKAYLDANGIGVRAAALDLKVSPSTISDLMLGKSRDVKASLVAAFCHRYLLSADYILLGKVKHNDDIEDLPEPEQKLITSEEGINQEINDSSMSYRSIQSCGLSQSNEELIESLQQQVKFLQNQVQTQLSIIDNLTKH